MDLSIIVPVYNVESYLKRSLDSILHQETDLEYEVILISDGSTDRSPEICQSYADRYPQVRYYSKENEGVAEARNMGLDMARGKYITFCDADDYYSDGFLNSVQENLKGQAELLIYSYFNEEEDKGESLHQQPRRLGRSASLDQEAFRASFSELFAQQFLSTLWNKVYLRAFVEKLGTRFKPVDSGEDVRFNLSLCPGLRTVELIDEPYYHYIVSRTDSLTNHYEKGRVNDKIGEYNALEETLEAMAISDQELLNKVKNDSFLALVHRAIRSDMTTSELVAEIQRISQLPTFEVIDTSYGLVNRLIVKMLKRGIVRPYIYFYRCYSKLKRKLREGKKKAKYVWFEKDN